MAFVTIFLAVLGTVYNPINAVVHVRPGINYDHGWSNEISNAYGHLTVQDPNATTDITEAEDFCSHFENKFEKYQNPSMGSDGTVKSWDFEKNPDPLIRQAVEFEADGAHPNRWPFGPKTKHQAELDVKDGESAAMY